MKQQSFAVGEPTIEKKPNFFVRFWRSYRELLKEPETEEERKEDHLNSQTW